MKIKRGGSMGNTNQVVTLVEKRRHLRFYVHYLADVYLNDEIIYATVIDISEDGVGIILPDELNLGEVISIKITWRLNDDEKANIQFKAKLIWIDEPNIKKTYTGGLEIINISNEDLDKLRKHIQVLADRAEKE